MMKLGCSIVVLSALMFGVVCASGAETPLATQAPLLEVVEPPQGRTIDFSSQILPIFRRSCLACHNSKDAEGGVVLETPDLIAKGGESGPSVLPGKGGESLLFKLAVREEKPFMPPRNNKAGAPALTPVELGLVRAWIDQGATGTVAAAFPVKEWNPIPESVRQVNSLAVTPDGRHVVANRGNRLHVHSAVTGELSATLADPSIPGGAADHDILQSIAVSPDGEWIATGAYKSLKLWRRDHTWTKTERSLGASLPGPSINAELAATLKSAVKTVLPSPDGSRLAVLLEDGRLCVVEAGEAQKLAHEYAPGAPIRRAVWSQGKPWIAILAADEVVRILNAMDGKLLAEFREHPASLDLLTRARVADVRAGLLTAHLQSAHDARVDFEKKEAESLAKAKEKLDQQEKAHQAKLKEKADADDQLAKARAELESSQKEIDGAPVALAGAETRKGEATAAMAAVEGELGASSRRLAELEPALERLVRRVAEDGFATRVAELRLAEARLAKTPDEAALAAEAATKLAALKITLAEHKGLSSEFETVDRAKIAALDSSSRLRSELEELNKAIAQIKSSTEEASKRIPEAKKRVEEGEKRLAALVEPLRVTEGARDGAMQALKSIEESLERARAAIELAKTELDQAKAHKDALSLEFQKASEASKIPRPALSIALSPEGGLAAVLHADGSIVVWSIPTARCVNVLQAEGKLSSPTIHFKSESVLAVESPDGDCFESPVHASWSLALAIGGGREDAPFADRVMALDFSPDSKLIAAGGGFPSRGSELSLFALPDGGLVHTHKDIHSDTILAVRFSPGGELLLTGGADKFGRVVDVSSGRQWVAFEGHTHHVQAVAWIGAGKSVSTASADKTLKIWDLATGEQRRTHGGFGKELNSVAYVGPDQGIQVSSGESQLKWIAEDGKEIRRFNGASGFMTCGAVDLAGGVVAAGSLDGVVRVWEGATGKLLHTLSAPPADTLRAAAK